VAGEVQQQDQWRHAAALDGAEQSAPDTLITEKIGDDWITDLDQLRAAGAPAEDRRASARVARSQAATASATWPSYPRAHRHGVDPASMFDVQVKRIHEYKRQHLNMLHVIALYHRLKRIPPTRSRRAPSSSAAKPRPATTWPS
jgi:glucan phosphorylase